ncbi:hypothetical protein MPER_08075 [Moniliophthora perniciosa FA553]|nr:hypothetical protein MPER_08075 [Moniliophthora perniciosa FA553]
MAFQVNNALDEEASPMPFISVAIVAGSDTTASALSGVIYYLLANPSYIDLLRNELKVAFPPLKDGHLPLELEKLAELPLLNGIINETLRLQPPIPTGLQRAPERGSGGRLVGTHFVHEDTAILVPPYVLHRDPRYFWPKPDTFWPERWIEYQTNPDIILETAAFIPFSSGPANCAGKRLAILELRFVVALLVSRFDMRFTPGWDIRKWEEGLKDRFMISKGELMVEISLR